MTKKVGLVSEVTENSEIVCGAVMRGILSSWICMLIMDKREMRLLNLEKLLSLLCMLIHPDGYL